MIYQPKGSMCRSCQSRDKNCSGLKFSNMPVIEKDGGVRVVKCAEYKRRMEEAK